MSDFATRALNEYNTLTVRPGGVNGNPFWNMNSSQFTYAPAFYFPCLPNYATKNFLFTATDKNGNTHSFTAEKASADLLPIWSELPTGVVTLKVEALDDQNNPVYLMGTRTFFKCSPFPGRENMPPKARSYKEASLLALKYVFEQPMIQHWLEFGKPDPEFPHNVYPAKTFSSVISAMLVYAKISPENADKALKIATIIADYMLSISYDESSPLCGLPPTYCFNGLNAEKVNKIAPAAEGCKDTTMLIYPAAAGNAYLKLFKETKNQKYFDAALIIANYYKNHVLPNGSWYLQISSKTGLPLKNNYCNYFDILNFLTDVEAVTGDAVWHTLTDNYFSYLKKTCLDNYNWEGQFEDIPVTSSYYNLTHVNASVMINHITNHNADDPEMMENAKELMRFIEDQFVVWGEFAPWVKALCPEVKSPAGLEQYLCYWPIDASTSKIMSAFLDMYRATNDSLYFEKAAALGDMITRMQDPTNGVIPTFWTTKENIEDLENFWINCHIASAFRLYELSVAAGEM